MVGQIIFQHLKHVFCEYVRHIIAGFVNNEIT